MDAVDLAAVGLEALWVFVHLALIAEELYFEEQPDVVVAAAVEVVAGIVVVGTDVAAVVDIVVVDDIAAAVVVADGQIVDYVVVVADIPYVVADYNQGSIDKEVHGSMKDLEYSVKKKNIDIHKFFFIHIMTLNIYSLVIIGLNTVKIICNKIAVIDIA